MVTIRDVAKHAGVSPATVSRVVNGLVGYSDETRERVETAVKSLSYETDYLARGLKTRQTSVIGLLAPMVSDALASQVMQGVEEEAQERGYAVMLGRTGAKSAYITACWSARSTWNRPAPPATPARMRCSRRLRSRS